MIEKYFFIFCKFFRQTRYPFIIIITFIYTSHFPMVRVRHQKRQRKKEKLNGKKRGGEDWPGVKGMLQCPRSVGSASCAPNAKVWTNLSGFLLSADSFTGKPVLRVCLRQKVIQFLSVIRESFVSSEGKWLVSSQCLVIYDSSVSLEGRWLSPLGVCSDSSVHWRQVTGFFSLFSLAIRPSPLKTKSNGDEDLLAVLRYNSMLWKLLY